MTKSVDRRRTFSSWAPFPPSRRKHFSEPSALRVPRCGTLTQILSAKQQKKKTKLIFHTVNTIKFYGFRSNWNRIGHFLGWCNYGGYRRPTLVILWPVIGATHFQHATTVRKSSQCQSPWISNDLTADRILKLWSVHRDGNGENWFASFGGNLGYGTRSPDSIREPITRDQLRSACVTQYIILFIFFFVRYE